MKATVRPEQINEILDSLVADEGVKSELETYIADLEAKQPDRPTRIAKRLAEVGSRYSAEVKASLEAYISELEGNQQPVPQGKLAPSTESLYWRSVRREKEQRAHALKKQNHNRS